MAFREQEAGSVVGYLAGLVERARAGPDVVASVGGGKFVAQRGRIRGGQGVATYVMLTEFSGKRGTFFLRERLEFVAASSASSAACRTEAYRSTASQDGFHGPGSAGVLQDCAVVDSGGGERRRTLHRNEAGDRG
jgi:hypothetical protein